MTRPFLLLFSLLTGLVQAQVIAPADTFLCQGGPMSLTATYLGGGGSTTYADSIIPYFWESAALSGSYNGPDDQHSGIVNIGFDFCFYGQTYSQVVVSTNNYLTFDLSNASGFSPWTTQALPNPNEPLASIMGPWLDINPATGGTITYGTVGTAPFRKFVASFNNVPMFSCTSLLYKGQIVIYETTNVIETHIENLPLCSNWNGGNSVHGLHNETGTAAYTVTGRNNTPTTFTNEGRRFYGTGTTNVIWYDENFNALDTGLTVTVNPTTSTTYYLGLECGGIQDSVFVQIGSVGASFDVRDESCYAYDDGEATVLLPNNGGQWDITWLNVFNNVLQVDNNITGSATINGLAAGAYFVEMYDQVNDCSVIDTVYINQPPPIVLNEQVMNAFCDQNNGSIDLTLTGGFGPLTFSWDDGTPTLDRENLSPGDYTIYVVDSIGCDSTITFTIANEYPVTADLSASPMSGLAPLTVNFNNLSTGGTSYGIEFGTGDSGNNPDTAYTFSENGIYTVVLYGIDSLSGCTDTTTLIIDVTSDPRVMMPNVFSPGGNFPYFNAVTANDSTANIDQFQGIIYTRWGNTVYEWSDWSTPSAGWDGTVGGSEASEGVYYYTVRATGGNGKTIEQSGLLMLIRND